MSLSMRQSRTGFLGSLEYRADFARLKCLSFACDVKTNDALQISVQDKLMDTNCRIARCLFFAPDCIKSATVLAYMIATTILAERSASKEVQYRVKYPRPSGHNGLGVFTKVA